jgi:methylated-DNA-[protein]-cysteine S-methyltransferase
MGMSNHRVTIYASPIGPLTLTADGTALSGLWFPGRGPVRAETGQRPEDFAQAIDQLQAYFAGGRREFDLPLRPRGTLFQRRVWSELQRIPYGTTTTYGALAQRLSDEHGEWVSPRAVGAANGANPISIIVPCHRVIGSDGSLTGYGGGLQRKRALLELETAVTADVCCSRAAPPQLRAVLRTEFEPLVDSN